MSGLCFYSGRSLFWILSFSVFVLFCPVFAAEDHENASEHLYSAGLDGEWSVHAMDNLCHRINKMTQVVPFAAASLCVKDPACRAEVTKGMYALLAAMGQEDALTSVPDIVKLNPMALANSFYVALGVGAFVIPFSTYCEWRKLADDLPPLAPYVDELGQCQQEHRKEVESGKFGSSQDGCRTLYMTFEFNKDCFKRFRVKAEREIRALNSEKWEERQNAGLSSVISAALGYAMYTIPLPGAATIGAALASTAFVLDAYLHWSIGGEIAKHQEKFQGELDDQTEFSRIDAETFQAVCRR